MRVPPPYARMIAMKPEAGARASTIVSAAFQIGLAAYHRERLYDIERADAMDGDHRRSPSPAKSRSPPTNPCWNSSPRTFPAEVEVTAGGKTLRKRVTAAAGDPGRALDDAALADKAKRILGHVSTEIIQAGLDGFQSEDSCKRLADAMWQATMD